MPGLWVDPAELTVPANAYSDAAEEAALTASTILWALTGRKYDGVRTITERYEPELFGALSVRAGLVISKAGDGSNWLSKSGPRYLRDGIRLRKYPVRSVQSLQYGYDGTEVPIDEWELTDRTTVRMVPGASWTPLQEMVVTYTYGALPPRAGVRAARLLANELILADLHDENCRLPDRVTSVTRQGTSYTILDPQDFLDHGRTGIPEVDSFIKAVNPSGALMKARVINPGSPRAQSNTTY